MTYVPATGEYGIVIRKDALAEKGIEARHLFAIMANVNLLGQDESVISFGPLFGAEALAEIGRRLEASCLGYVDDFFTLDFMTPDWLKIGVAVVGT